MSMWKDISPRGGVLSYQCLLGLIMLCVLPLECTELVCDVCGCQAMNETFAVNCNEKGLPNVTDYGFPVYTTKIDLRYNKINSIRTNEFITSKELQILWLGSNNISTIEANAFRNLTSLIHLSLYHNNISHLDNQTFQGLFSLEILDLGYNYISTIQANAFSDLTSLTHLELSYNEISAIQDNAFRNLTSLTYLGLAHNRISHLDSQTFQGLLSLKEKDLGNNDISSIQPNAFRDLTSLTKLDLDSNNISSIQANAFKDLTSLTILGLDDNHIFHLDSQTFQGLLSLKEINLYGNEITVIEKDTFFFMSEIERVDLSCNNISSIQANAFRNLTFLTILISNTTTNTCVNTELNVELKNNKDIILRTFPVQETTCMECNTASVESCLREGTLTQCSQMNSCHLTIDVTDGQQTVITQCQKVEECIGEMRKDSIACVNGEANQQCSFCCTGNNCTASLDYSGYTYQAAMLIQFTLNSAFTPALSNKASSKFMQESTQITTKMNEILSSVNGVEINVSSFKITGNGLTRCNLNTTSVWALPLGAEAIQHTLFTTLNESIDSIGLDIIPGSLFLAPPGFCQQEEMPSEKGKFNWESTLVGNEAIRECPYPSILIGTRACVVGKSFDPVWGEPDLDDCLVRGSTTEELRNLAYEVVTTENVNMIAFKLHELTSSDMNATDVQFMSLTLVNLLETSNVTMNLESGKNVLGTYNNLMRLDDETLEDSQQVFGSINRSLTILDNLSGKLDTIPPDGTITLPQVALGVLPANSSTGDAVFRIHKSTNESFEQQRVTLTNNTTFKPNETAVAIEIPASILQGTNKSVQFVAFTDDTLFKAMENNTEEEAALHPQQKINSQIVSASIDSQHVENLTDPIRITFNHKTQRAQSPECVYWDFESSSWSSHGCHTLENETNEYTVCQCDHLTYFALLMDIFGEGDDVSAEDELALTLISHVGCSISLASLLLTLMAYSFFSKLRKDDKAKLLMNLCSALTMVMMFFILVTQPSIRGNTIACQVTAGLLHYFVMATWTWMAVGAFHMYFTVIKVFNTYIKRFLLKCCLIGWGVPAIIVIITVAISTDDYGVQGDDNICWLAGNAFYGGCVAPILFILVGNFVVFGLVIHQIRKLSERREEHGAKVTMIKTQLRGAFTLVVLLGLTWVFAIFAFWKGGIVFIYLFTIFNSLQGLFIFIFYFALKREVRDILQKKIKSLSSSGGTATTGLSNTQSPLTPSAPELDQAVTTTDAGLSDAQSPSTSSAPGHHQAVTTTDAGLSDAQSPSTSSAPKRHHAVITTDSGLSDNQSP